MTQCKEGPQICWRITVKIKIWRNGLEIQDVTHPRQRTRARLEDEGRILKEKNNDANPGQETLGRGYPKRF